jgi:hypothetical protein
MAPGAAPEGGAGLENVLAPDELPEYENIDRGDDCLGIWADRLGTESGFDAAGFICCCIEDE